MRDFADQIVDLDRDTLVVRVERSHRHQLATGFEEVKLWLEFGHLSCVLKSEKCEPDPAYYE
jgi:hypothetical protein